MATVIIFLPSCPLPLFLLPSPPPQQNALWASKRHFNGSLCLLEESVSSEDGGPGAFINHFGSNVAGQRVDKSKAQLARQGVGSGAAFAAVIDEMLATPGVVDRSDPLDLALAIAAQPLPGGRLPYATLDHEYWKK